MIICCRNLICTKIRLSVLEQLLGAEVKREYKSLL